MTLVVYATSTVVESLSCRSRTGSTSDGDGLGHSKVDGLSHIVPMALAVYTLGMVVAVYTLEMALAAYTLEMAIVST